MARFHFKKDLKYDLALLSETIAKNPFSVPKSKAKPLWEKVATALQNCNLKMDVSERLARERVTKLLVEFRQGEALSIKSSGQDEEGLDNFKELLTTVSFIEKDTPGPVTPKAKGRKPQKRAAEQTRDRAVLNFSETLQADELKEKEEEDRLHFESDSGNEIKASTSSFVRSGTTQTKLFPDIGPKPSKVSKKGNEASEIVAYLQGKSEKEFEYKNEELKVRQAEAQNKEMELKLQMQRQDQEFQERSKMNDLFIKMLERKGSND